MIYFFLFTFIVVGAVLFSNLRLRISLDENHRLVFIGLGRNGLEIDLVRQVGHIKIFGLRLKSFARGAEKEKKISPVKKIEKAEKKPKKIKRQRSRRDILRVLPQSLRATGLFCRDIIKAVAFEELEGELAGGFDSPDWTGRAYGYYQALCGAVPSMAGYFRFYPNWSGASLSGSLRLSVVLPFYVFLYRTLVLLLRLPLRKIIKVAIGTKKGEKDVK